MTDQNDNNGDDNVPVKISVSQEIRKFQQEINKMQEENCKFFIWKSRRQLRRQDFSPRPGLTTAVSSDCLLSASQEEKKKKKGKKVSYCDAVTVFGSSESLMHGKSVKIDTNNNDASDALDNVCDSNDYMGIVDNNQSNVTNTDEDDFILPSVKKIVTLFQDDKNQNQNNPAICPPHKSSEASLTLLSKFLQLSQYLRPCQTVICYLQAKLSTSSPPRMLTVKGQNCNLSQV